MILRHPERLSHSVLSVLASQALAVATAIRTANPNGVLLDGDDSDARLTWPPAVLQLDGRSLMQHPSRVCGIFVTSLPREDRAGTSSLRAATLVRGLLCVLSGCRLGSDAFTDSAR